MRCSDGLPEWQKTASAKMAVTRRNVCRRCERFLRQRKLQENKSALSRDPVIQHAKMLRHARTTALVKLHCSASLHLESRLWAVSALGHIPAHLHAAAPSDQPTPGRTDEPVPQIPHPGSARRNPSDRRQSLARRYQACQSHTICDRPRIVARRFDLVQLTALTLEVCGWPVQCGSNSGKTSG